MSAPTTFSVALHNETATAQLMADLALLVGPGDVITLTGDLGAGKTAAARALIRYLAGDEALEVPSPTFTLVQGYELPPFPVMHADLYRVEDESELEEIGLSPLPDATLVLIEWPERAPSAMPQDRIDIALTHRPALGSNARAADITGYGKAAAAVARLQALREFLDASGYMDATRKRMAGDASTRSYARLLRNDEIVILMNFPQRPDGAATYNGKSYSAAVHLAENVKPFVAIDEGLRAQGISAPAIHHSDLDHGFLITEDFGSEGVIEGDPPRPIAERYEAAADVLAVLHGKTLPETLPLDGQTYAIPVFDAEALLIEIGLMPEWYLPDRNAPLSDDKRAEFFAMWRELLRKPLAAPRTWIIRDYHSPNLIWLPDRAGIARVGVIDFQDTVLGPQSYDVVSLLQDARIDVPESLELTLLSRYIKARRAGDAGFDPAGFAELYAIMSAQRNTRLLGTFARLNRRDGKPHYLRHQPPDLDLSPALAGTSRAELFARLVSRQRPSAPKSGLIRRPIYQLLAKTPVFWRRGSRIITGWSGQMAVKTDQRGNSRVVFERGISAQMMGIDGTWRRDCTMEDVSETGAKLTIDGSVEGLHLKEFFLLLSSTGLAYRRCELAWVNGDQIGVNFLKLGDKKKKARSTAVGA
ncbi:tRNA threonylcarbamoyl adenosine modification protein YjeE [Bradyrhizobium ottawaense]